MIFSIVSWILCIISDLSNTCGFLVVTYTLLTWIPRLLIGKVGWILRKIAEPYSGMFERFIPPITGISFALVIVLSVIYFAGNYVLYWIANIIRYVFIRQNGKKTN